MKTYKAYFKQEGEGCDYTIGCGNAIVTLKANTIEEATQKIEEYILENLFDHERRLKTATIFEVSNIVELDVKSLYKKEEKRIEDSKEKEVEEKERKEFERLKIKYGK